MKQVFIVWLPILCIIGLAIYFSINNNDIEGVWSVVVIPCFFWLLGKFDTKHNKQEKDKITEYDTLLLYIETEMMPYYKKYKNDTNLANDIEFYQYIILCWQQLSRKAQGTKNYKYIVNMCNIIENIWEVYDCRVPSFEEFNNRTLHSIIDSIISLYDILNSTSEYEKKIENLVYTKTSMEIEIKKKRKEKNCENSLREENKKRKKERLIKDIFDKIINELVEDIKQHENQKIDR